MRKAPIKKKPTSFTLSEESLEQLEELKEKTGGSKTVILERLIAEKYTNDSVTNGNKRKKRPHSANEEVLNHEQAPAESAESADSTEV